MIAGSWRMRVWCLALAAALAGGLLAATGGKSQAAASCPQAVDSQRHLSPGPHPYVDWDHCDLVSANLEQADLDFANLSWTYTAYSNAYEASFSAANLEHADLTQVNLQYADLSESDLTDASLNTANLEHASLLNANLTGANLTGADLTGANLTGTDVDGVTWTDVTCPDGSLAEAHAPAGCLTALDTTAPAAAPLVSAGTAGSHGWYLSPVTVSWHWTDDGMINAAACPASGTTAGNGAQELTASCADRAGNAGTARYSPIMVDTSKPAVSVTGIRSGARYLYGSAPAARCVTRDAVSGVGAAASVKVTSAGRNGAGKFSAACAGAVSVAGASQAGPVRVSYTVIFGMRGFTPAPKSVLKKSLTAFTVKFRLAGSSGTAIAPSVAAGLAAGHDVRVVLRGPGVSPLTSACAWSRSAQAFQCSVKTPEGVHPGKGYTLTAYENVGTGFVVVPGVKTSADPETIYFR